MHVRKWIFDRPLLGFCKDRRQSILFLNDEKTLEKIYCALMIHTYFRVWWSDPKIGLSNYASLIVSDQTLALSRFLPIYVDACFSKHQIPQIFPSFSPTSHCYKSIVYQHSTVRDPQCCKDDYHTCQHFNYLQSKNK